jgi:hypothetical protein
MKFYKLRSPDVLSWLIVKLQKTTLNGNIAGQQSGSVAQDMREGGHQSRAGLPLNPQLTAH